MSAFDSRSNTSTSLGRALALAGQGLPCFPCCMDKRPATPRGFKDATCDRDLLHELWLQYPGELVGVPTGGFSGLDVLDIDRRHGGDRWFAEYRHRLPPTRVHRTRSGGLHLLFQHGPGLRCSAGRIAAGVDVRATGGYFIWWPATGLAVLSEFPVGRWPGWLLRQVLSAPRAVTQRTAVPDDHVLQRLVQLIAGARNGERNNLTYWAACRAGEMVASGMIEASFAVALITEAATRAGLSRTEAARTAWSGVQTTGGYVRPKAAARFVELALKPKPELLVHSGNLPATAETLRDLLAATGKFFDRGVPVRLIKPADSGLPSAVSLTRHSVVMEAHRLCQPVKVKSNGEHIPVTLPDRVAQMYLDMSGEWKLAPLTGVSSAPLLSADGSVRAADGYDPATGLWCGSVPKLTLPARPSLADARSALGLLRRAFETFPFGDAIRRWEAARGVEVIDMATPPGRDESAFLIALLTAVCRPSLWLAPGMLMTAPAVSGAGSGKGLLVREYAASHLASAPVRSPPAANDKNSKSGSHRS
jgi:Bifunctional DNA primase/polymerase, N-terminal